MPAEFLTKFAGACSRSNANGVLSQSPRLARQRLPWVDIQNREKPQPGCDPLALSNISLDCHNPVGVDDVCCRFPR